MGLFCDGKRGAREVAQRYDFSNRFRCFRPANGKENDGGRAYDIERVAGGFLRHAGRGYDEGGKGS